MQRKIDSEHVKKKQEGCYCHEPLARRREVDDDEIKGETERKCRNKRQRCYDHSINGSDHFSGSPALSFSSTPTRSIIDMSSSSSLLRTRRIPHISVTSLSNVSNYSPRTNEFRNLYFLPSGVMPSSDNYIGASISSPYHMSGASTNMMHLPTAQSLIIPSLASCGGLPHFYYGHTPDAFERRDYPSIPSPPIGDDTVRRFSTGNLDRFQQNFVDSTRIGTHHTGRKLNDARKLIIGAEEKKQYQKKFESVLTRPYMPLSSPEDKQYLSPRQCYLRKVFIEVFKADESHVLRRRSSKVLLNQIGFRCRFCAHLDPKVRAKQ